MVGVSVVLAIVALALSYAGRALLRPEPFADRAVAALRQPAVSDEVADRLADAVVRSGSGDLATPAPLVRAATGSIVPSPAFLALLRRALFEEPSRGPGPRGHDGGQRRRRGSAGGRPAAAVRSRRGRNVDAERAEHLLTLEPGDGVLSVVRIARRVYAIAWVLGVIALLVAVAAIWRSRARRRTIRQLGTGLAIGGMVLVALYTIGGAVAAQLAPSGRGPVVAALWQAFLRAPGPSAVDDRRRGGRRRTRVGAAHRRRGELRWPGWRQLAGSQ